MRRTVFIILLALAGLSGGAGAAKPDRSLEEVLAGIAVYDGKLHSLTAAFEQLVEVPVLEKKERFRGTFYLQKPDFIRLEYSYPKGQLMVADGSYYWFYQPQEDIPQAMRAPIEQASGAMPRYILGGDLKASFEVSLVGMEERGSVRCYVLDLAPKAEAPYYRNLRAWVDASTFATRAVRYEDESGNFNTFDLSDQKENVEIGAQKFVFTPPPGTQVLDAQ